MSNLQPKTQGVLETSIVTSVDSPEERSMTFSYQASIEDQPYGSNVCDMEKMSQSIGNLETNQKQMMELITSASQQLSALHMKVDKLSDALVLKNEQQIHDEYADSDIMTILEDCHRQVLSPKSTLQLLKSAYDDTKYEEPKKSHTTYNDQDIQLEDLQDLQSFILAASGTSLDNAPTDQETEDRRKRLHKRFEAHNKELKLAAEAKKAEEEEAVAATALSSQVSYMSVDDEYATSLPHLDNLEDSSEESEADSKVESVTIHTEFKN